MGARTRLSLVLFAMGSAVTTGCADSGGDGPASGQDWHAVDGGGDAPVDPGAVVGFDAAPDAAQSADVPPEIDAEPTDPVGALCARYNADRSQLEEGVWTGNLEHCAVGDVITGGRERALVQVNLYRYMAGLPPVTHEAQRDQRAQACSLLMEANGALDHNPGPDWACYSEEGALAAGESNLSPTAGVAAIETYMLDVGNEDTLGHRRWILSNRLGPIGIGSASAFSCLLVTGGEGQADAPWTAWPPPGLFPIQAAANTWWHLDSTGWSIQSDTLAFEGAAVQVTSLGEALPVDTNVLWDGYGGWGNRAIRIVPAGWTLEAGRTYDVEAWGPEAFISYSFYVVDCDAEPR